MPPRPHDDRARNSSVDAASIPPVTRFSEYLSKLQWAVVALSLPVFHPVRAQLPAARLDGVFPPGGRIGSEVEITVKGVDLDDAKELHFSDHGIKARHIEGQKFKVTLEGSVPPGTHEVRAAGRYGISTSAVFAAGSLNEVNENGDNHTRAGAFALTLPVTVNGTVDPDASDFFRFTAGKDQRLHIECAAQRIDSPVNPVLRVRDSAGTEIEGAASNLDRDPVIELTAPADGEYTVEVCDIAWRGGANSHYRLTISSSQETPLLPPPLPLAGATAALPRNSGVDEKEPNDSEAAAQQLALPADVSGKLDDDWFSFSGDKGRNVIVEVFSHRLGAASDPLLVVRKITRDAKGAEQNSQVAEFDDTGGPQGADRFRLGTRDPSGRIVCEEGAVYRVLVADRFNTGARYRLILRDPQPDFQLLAMPESPVITDGKNVQRWSPLLRRNGSTLVSVAALRRDGFDAPVTLRVDGLPPGVTGAETVIPAGMSTGVIVLRATPDVKTWSGRLQITGQAGDVVRKAREVTPRWNVGDSNNERVDLRLSAEGFMIAVNDAQTAPLAVESAEQKVYETSLAGNIEVPVKFTRDASHKGFNGEWEVGLLGLPGLRQWKPVKPPGDAKDAKLPLSFAKRDGNQFTPGTWNVYASARGTVKWQPEEKTPARDVRDTVFSAPITVKLEASPVFLTSPAEVSVAPGSKAECTVKVERRYGFNEGVELSLRVPDGVKSITAQKANTPKETGEAKLVIECATGTAAGKHGCTVEAKCNWNGEELFTRREIVVEIKP